MRDSNTRRSEIEWNEEQAKVLPNISVHTAKLLALRATSKQLKSREKELVQLLESQAKQTPSEKQESSFVFEKNKNFT